ncbi:MAG: DNA polymerase III subunit alpha [Bacteroidales bacterium]|nr:DNA polymerase III subunit alpha [Bacteroidales bacterium]MBS3774724.1 DNA polymerase III subunit alpha [Bacteroidales bacterium]
MGNFTHLHVHTQYSILDGASDVSNLLTKAKHDGMDTVAITDHGNMFGVKDFHNKARQQGIKPIIGCEMYLAHKSRFDKSDKKDRSGYHLVVLAKNYTGYKNLIKLISYAWTEGFYYTSRIDKELLKQYSEGLIVSTACIGGEIPKTAINQGKEEAEKLVLEYKETFGDDFYLELQRHPSGDPSKDQEVYENEKIANGILLDLAKKHDVKVIASNDVHFIDAEDAEPHDRLICLNTGKDVDDPDRMSYTKQEYFKTTEEMSELFSDIPEAIENTREIADKVEEYELDREPLMPDFPLPEGFENEDEYLRHITYEGARDRYGEITDEIRERLDFELSVIKGMGFPGYFLIVQDFINVARELDVSVGPGRGSAAGSAVAYCIKITDVDPIRYNLLFERFLNPDRISMPDIDIDFDEDGRDKVLDWVVKKYGVEKVAHIITFGTMKARLAIRDIARVEKLPLAKADQLAKLVPEAPGMTFKTAYEQVPALKKERENGDELVRKTLKYAEVLEGSLRQTGLHACGVIIGKDDLTEYLPICTSKDTDLRVTQFDGDHVESVGMLKMDFLGLKTLSIIKDAVENVKESRDIDVDIDNISLEDKETFQLYSRGETTALFQFESPGMKKNLRQLKPNRFEDLIAMNALYRPGPMEYIPSFIKRKHGQEEINYDLPVMEQYLKETYGITVYQEQVMQLSQELAGFSKGQADSLRKAMGKKKKKLMEELKEKFFEGCQNNGYDLKVIQKIWNDWEAFAQYAFNKSHSTCYAYVSYQTAYLKAHYPAEYMAAVLSRWSSNIEKVTTFMDECRRMGIQVLGPDINESNLRFNVNQEGNIRFGLSAIKGVGDSAAEKIIEERDQNGPYKDIYDFVERVNLQSVNKKCFESLATAGAFDNLGNLKRSQFFAENGKEMNFIESLMKYGSKYQHDKQTRQQTLFGESGGIEIAKPKLPEVEEWQKLDKLNKEKELVGIYLSAHPLDDFKTEIEQFTDTSLKDLNSDFGRFRDKDVTVAGIVTNVQHAMSKNNKPYGRLTLQDYTDSYEFIMFGKDYQEFRKFFYKDYPLFVKGKIQPRFSDSSLYEFKIKQIHMLSDVKEELVNTLTVTVSLSDINEHLIEELNRYTERKGKVRMRFRIVDPVDNISLNMYSRAKRIELTDGLMDFLRQNSAIQYSLS